MGKKKNNNWIKFRHKFLTAILRYPVQLVFFLLFKFRPCKVKLNKDENVFIISNHQSDFDPIFLGLSLNKPIYYVGTDTLFNKSFVSRLLNFAFAPIPKRKGLSDPKCIKSMFKIAKEKGTPVLEQAANEVRERAILVTKEVLKKLEEKETK